MSYRRLKQIRITAGLLLEWLKHFDEVKTSAMVNGVPEDAKVEDISCNSTEESFTILIYSETFDIVKAGVTPPILQIDVTKIEPDTTSAETTKTS